MADVLTAIRERIDQAGRRHAWLGFPLGVLKKFSEDRAGHQAALIAYFSFFSLFPLLLAMVTILAIVLRGRPEMQARIVDSALAQFPIIGGQIRQNVGSLSDSGLALVLSLAAALWAGLAGIKAMQNAMDHVWDVPLKDQGGQLKRIARGAIMLGVLGLFAVLATALTGIGTALGEVSPLARGATLTLSIAVNFGLFLLAFRMLTVADVSWRDVMPGAAVAAITWALLQAAGNYLVARHLRNASELYGFFGVVLGLLSWLYLGAQIVLFSAEINVVKRLRLWPRSFGAEPVTEVDRRALRRHAKVEERSPSEKVDARFTDERRRRPAG